jgi:chemotaxis protein CheD
MTTGYSLRTIVQGEVHVSDEPDLAIVTTVGSCVAACLFDPKRSVGGMNHFLLPDDPSGAGAQDARAQRYGVQLMELLVNGLLSQGASRGRLQAKVFGGARITHGLTDAGPRNADFVEHFLRHEGIPLVGGSLRGTQGRRVQFWPASGRARQMLCGAVEAVAPMRKPAIIVASGELELF